MVVNGDRLLTLLRQQAELGSCEELVGTLVFPSKSPGHVCCRQCCVGGHARALFLFVQTIGSKHLLWLLLMFLVWLLL